MQLDSQQLLPVSQAQAWEALNDVALLQAAIPGCESLTRLDDNRFEAQISAAVGPVKARFKGRLELQDPQPPQGYRLVFDGQGGAAGHGKGRAEIRLQPQGEHETLLVYSVQASVGGKLAQLGSRLVDLAAQKMAADFFAAFEAQLRQRYAPAPVPAPAAPASWWARLRGWLGRLFGG